MTGYEYEVYEPQSICPAPGWRAIYLDEYNEQGWSAEPLIGWAVYKVSTESSSGREFLENQIHGVVKGGRYEAERANDVDHFWTYLAPGELDPAPGQAAAELARRHVPEPAEPPVLAVVTRAEYAWGGWRIWAAAADGGTPQEIVADLVLDQSDPARAADTFRALHMLGVPVGPPIGPEGEVPFWLGQEATTAGHAAAVAMTGRTVVMGLRDEGWRVLRAANGAELGSVQTSP